jgi:hypothetical protein
LFGVGGRRRPLRFFIISLTFGICAAVSESCGKIECGERSGNPTAPRIQFFRLTQRKSLHNLAGLSRILARTISETDRTIICYK